MPGEEEPADALAQMKPPEPEVASEVDRTVANLMKAAASATESVVANYVQLLERTVRNPK